LFIASDQGVNFAHLLFAEGDSCDEFEEWLRLTKSGIAVDFRQIFGLCSGLLEKKNYLLEDCVIEEEMIICETGDIMNAMYRRIEDGSLIVIKDICFNELMEDRLIENQIENLINLYHPCIASPIGFILVSGSGELKVMGLYSESVSLAEVIGASPAWWTATAKAKAVAGLVLGFRFAHSLGLIHGRLTTNNIVFDMNHRIQIIDLLSDLSGNGLSGFSREGWNPETDIRVFMSILFEIVAGCPANDEASVRADIPWFVSEMMGLSGQSREMTSFCDIFNTLKQHNFAIVSGVDSAEVLAFVDWIEHAEQLRE
jgi:hypothetical protein